MRFLPIKRKKKKSAVPERSTRQRVLAALVDMGELGLTDEQIAEVTGLSPSTARPRRIELCKAGLVENSGRKRDNDSGRAATIWVRV